MKVTGHKSLIASVIVALLVILIGAGCEITPKQKADAEYRAEDIAYYYGDSCVDRYLLYEDDGRYERYIGGTYCKKKLPGPYFGTLFETGDYKKDDHGNITFTSKKGYDFDTEDLVNLGQYSETRKGTIQDTTLTVKYRIWYEDDDYWHGGYYKSITQVYVLRQ